MNNERGWKGGVYNPGFPPNKAYLERKAKEFREAGIEFPEIKGVQFRRSKNEHKPRRNVVTRVVMVGFDPFNQSGLPEHIERQVVFDYYAGLEKQFVMDWVNEAPEGETRFGGIINWGDSYKVTHNVPYPADVVAPDTDEPFILTPEQRKAVLSVRDGLTHSKISERLLAPGSLDRLRHYEEGAIDRSIKPTQYFSPLQRTMMERGLWDMPVVFENGKLVNTDYKLQRINLCPELPMTNWYVFAFAGHMYKATPSVNGAPGHVELYMPSADDLTPVAVTFDLAMGLAELHDAIPPRRKTPARDHWEKHGDPYDGRPLPAGVTQSDIDGILNQQRDELEKKFPGAMARIRDAVDITRQTSQTTRNETMAQYYPSTPEEIADAEQAIQEASEGKLDYLLEGTQHDPKLRK